MSPALRVALSIARHARALLGGAVLEQRGEDLGGDAARQQLGEDRLLVGLVLVERAGGGLARLEDGGDQLARGRDLADHRLEAVVEERATSNSPASKRCSTSWAIAGGVAVAEPA